jgi:hypothetical protein
MMPNYILGLLSIEEETQSLGSYHRSWVVHNFTGSRSSLTNLLESSNAILGVKVEKNNRGRLDGHDEKKKQETTLFLLNKTITNIKSIYAMKKETSRFAASTAWISANCGTPRTMWKTAQLPLNILHR